MDGAGSQGSFRMPWRGWARVRRGEEVTERPAALDGCSARRRERECEGSFGILPCNEQLGPGLRVRSCHGGIVAESETSRKKREERRKKS